MVFQFLDAVHANYKSCTNDSAEEFLPQNKKTETTDLSLMQKEGDSIGLDTGGQCGSTPIKP